MTIDVSVVANSVLFDNPYPDARQLVVLDESHLLFVWQDTEVVPEENGHGSWVAIPIRARVLTLDPFEDSGEVTAGPRMTLCGHPDVDGVGDNPSHQPDGTPEWYWRIDPTYWTAVAVSPTRVLVRFYDGTGFFDPYPGERGSYLRNGVVTYDYGWPEAGHLVFDIDVEASTFERGPWNPVTNHDDFPIGRVQPLIDENVWPNPPPYVENEYNQYPTSDEDYSVAESGRFFVATTMLTSTRGVTTFANTGISTSPGFEDEWGYWNAEVCAQTFEINPDGTFTYLDFFIFPYVAGLAPTNTSWGDTPVWLTSRVSNNQFVLFFAPYIVSQAAYVHSFAVSGAGVISHNGGDYVSDDDKWYDPAENAACLAGNTILVLQWDAGFDYQELWTMVVPTSGPPVPSATAFLTRLQMVHPDELPDDSLDYKDTASLSGDAQGRWVMTYESTMAEPGKSDPGSGLYAMGGKFDGVGGETHDGPVRLTESFGAGSTDWATWWGTVAEFVDARTVVSVFEVERNSSGSVFDTTESATAFVDDGTISESPSVVVDVAYCGDHPADPRLVVSGAYLTFRNESIPVKPFIRVAGEVPAGTVIDFAKRSIVAPGNVNLYDQVVQPAEWWEMIPGINRITVLHANSAELAFTQTWL